MGALGCKYCNCDREKLEDASEEMKIQYNNPIIITNGNKDKNNENNEKNKENPLKKEEDLNIKIEINNNIGDSGNKIPDINSLKANKEIVNNNINNILIENENDVKPIIENNNLQKSNLNNQNNIIDNNNNIIEDYIINNNDNNNNNNDNDKDNLFPISNNNNEFIIEENDLNKKNNNKQGNNLKESKTNQFSITNSKEAKNKIKKYEINKIKFGLKEEDKENLNKEQQQLYNEAENNLQQFSAPQGNEMTQLQTVMSNILFKLKNIFINIDLNSNRDDQEHILLNGNLKKMINYEINAHNPTMYSDRFCILFPKMLKYYKSQAQFLKNLKPSCVLPINQISAVNIARPKKSKKNNFHLIICNKLGIQKSVNNSVFLNLFDSCEINDFLASPDLNESLLIFTSDVEQDIYKWYIIIQYLIEFSKQQNQQN